MERESFSDPEVAARMNRLFVCVKLDREERPDVDKIYMSAVQAMTGQGGWPLNVFLTPDLKPFFGGTYFPPDARWGRPGWKQLLERIAQLWRIRRKDIESDADRLSKAVAEFVAAQAQARRPATAVLDAAWEALKGSYDLENGGFGGAPKFPMPACQRFLLRRGARTGDSEAEVLAVGALRAMSRGGIFDQLGGGFHRYSTDAQWRVPHFEKMLYDNAQLLENLADAVLVSRDAELSRALRRTVEYLRRDLRAAQGGFFCAEDADSLPPEPAGPVGAISHEHKEEGAFYLWTREEIEGLLEGRAAAFCARYGIEAEGENIPYDGAPEALSESQAQAARARLLEVRDRRPRPNLDDKILTSWNGLALSGLSRAFLAVGDPEILALADAAADFLRRELCDGSGKVLWRRWREGQRAVAGMADDYAFLAQGLLDLYEASFDPSRLAWALDLAEEAIRRFGAANGGLYQTAQGEAAELFARAIEDHDGVEPAASSVLADAALRLFELTGREDLRRFADATLERFGARLEARPDSMPYMLCALDRALGRPRTLVIAGLDLPGGGELLAAARARLRPDLVTAGFTARTKADLERLVPAVGAMALGARASARLCEGRSCGLPITDPEELSRKLDS
ncbi:MAG TPA: thioredoxin domain-containing protein [Elusimicrobia bacterium]|nr:thioredoxin domain-containing protein [Elusimicrobiota bacterium]